jgi:acyl-CoA thioester hydrolase
MKDKALKNYNVIYSTDVRWGQMDSWNHVNNKEYLSFMESARIKYFQAMGIFLDMNSFETGPMVAEITCRFRTSLVFPDNVHIGARVSSVYKYGFHHEYEIYSESQNKIVALGTCRLTQINYKTGVKIEIDDGILDLLEKVEGKRFPINER